ncbi:MAG: hypothetical protein KKE79_03960 [Actinobacteria bacterium]|nr:hypothetical protein [Actinomycetota bacterium]MBU4241400.1 hypothetical protein [Actinomycetota bacterium]MBU4385442.1 hypothetical protein [Actinomycetota bacterium]MBU4489771.1 hypothetical protein [Actinomycetota bacterium]MCG2796145.1 hypothetical protein [Actinomycetes bacterium]
MAYCPQCGREQKCGCDTCHTCGVELVERGHAPSRAGAPVPDVADLDAAEAGRTPPGPRARPDEAGPEAPTWVARSAVPAMLLVLGCTALGIAFLEMLRSTSDFTVSIEAVSIMSGLKRLGYYIGKLMYSSSYRLLLGFALVALGLLWEPPRPFEKWGTWRQAVRGAALLAFAMGACCFFAFILLLMPAWNQSVYVTNLLPALWIALPVMVVLGLSLAATGYILVAQINREPEELRRAQDPAADDVGRTR